MSGTIPRNLQPKEGNLEKKGRDGKWSKRYFELERSQLHYYNKGRKLGDTIHLHRDIPIKIGPEDSRIILVETPERLWMFRAESAKVAQEWATALRQHCQGRPVR